MRKRSLGGIGNEQERKSCGGGGMSSGERFAKIRESQALLVLLGRN